MHGQYYDHPGMVDACARAVLVSREVWLLLSQRKLRQVLLPMYSIPANPIQERLFHISSEPVQTPSLFAMDAEAWQNAAPSSAMPPVVETEAPNSA